MKILLVQDYLRSGGTERQTVLLARAFAAAGHPTSLITFRPSGSLAPSLPPNVEVHSLQPVDLHLDWFAPGLVRAAQKIQPDIVLCMGRMANGAAGRLQKSLPRASVINTMRTGKTLSAAFRRSLLITRHVVANSGDAAATLAKVYGVPPEKISVIHNSLVFPSSRLPSATETKNLRASQYATAGTQVLLSVAMFRPEKNQRDLIEMVDGFPPDFDWQLWLAGDGEAKAACEALVRQKKRGDRVKFLGWQSDPSSLYGAANIAVHASRSESLSNFLIEAQSRGLPAVAFAAQGNAECFISGDTGHIIPSGDLNQFRDAVMKLASASPSEREARATRARDYAARTFDPAQQVAAYLDLFERPHLRSSPL